MQWLRSNLSGELASKPIFFVADFPPPINGNNIVTESLFRLHKSEPGIGLKHFSTSIHSARMFRIQRLLIFIKVGIRVLFLPKKSHIYFGLAHRMALIGQSLIIISGLVRSCNVSVHHHSYFPMGKKEDLPCYVQLIHKYLIHHCTNIFLSEKMRMDYVQNWGVPVKSKILSNSFVPSVRFGESTPILPTEYFTLIHVSNLSKAKGSLLSLEVMEHFLKKNEKFRAVLMGSNSQAEFKETILRLQSRFPNQFTYHSEFHGNTLHQELKTSDVLLLPSNYENEASPLVVHEAQYSGVICVTSEAGTLGSEVLTPGEASGKFLAFADLVKKVEYLISAKALSIEEYYLDRETMRLDAVERGKLAIMTASRLF